MARKKNPFLRTIIPLAAILVGAGVVWAVAVNSSNTTKGAKQQTTASQTQAQPQAEAADESPEPASPPGEVENTGPAGDEQARGANDAEPIAAQPESTQETLPAAGDAGGEPAGASDEASDQSTQPQAETPSLRARVFEDVAASQPIGSLDGVGGQHMQVEFSDYGAGVKSLKLGRGFFTAVDSTEHVELQAERSVKREGMSDLTAVPLAALSISVNGKSVALASPNLWRPVGSEAGAFEAFIDDESGNPVLRLERRYSLVPSTFRLEIRRRTENLTDKPLTVRWIETGPIDLPVPTMGYGGDKRRVRFGYLLNPQQQAGSETVTADSELEGHPSLLRLGGLITDPSGAKRVSGSEPIWPTAKTEKEGQRLVWAAFTSRYFGVALHPLYDPTTVQPGGDEKLFTGVERLDRLVLNPYIAAQSGNKSKEGVIVLRVTSARETIGPGAASEASTGLYAGPLLDDDLNIDELSKSLNLDGLIAYNFGGACGSFCTFGWLTHVLLFVLRAAHSLTRDWAASIIILVLIVRTSMHPITRWSQIRLQRFSKQMQGMAPKQQKIREKYKDDQKRMQQEMARLWKEEGVNPAGALGCLPMFLQSPVWIALYATLYFAAEMRQQPGFWGVFQAISGGHWHFLNDLSSPDAALPLPSFMHFTPPLVGSIYGKVTSINLLPILMAVLFYAHQKYLSPPSSASMTPEQEQQQKIMKIMFPIMMPIFMYAAPSGLCIYFITNSTLAIIENKHIRSSAEKQGLLDPEKIKAEKAARRAGGGGGFISRLTELAEERQKAQGRKQVQNTSGRPDPRTRSYKKRK
ncbi:MAG: membrane protein insertase YidC [Phycisphaeraceae bacterium]|nr:MAG: membrane protein insertase YidC [Phycisphaeraceae bacterium]